MKISFEKTSLDLFGGDSISINGCVACSRENISLVKGRNGSGKTMTLAAIGHLYESPGFKCIRFVDRSSVKIKNGPITPVSSVALVRQEPRDNYGGTTVSDEFRLVYSTSNLDEESFKKRLDNFLVGEVDHRIPYRNSNNLSSGEQQLMAVGAAILSDPDLILLDEPFARLSKKNALKVLRVLKDYATDAGIIMSTHEEDVGRGTAPSEYEALFHELDKTSNAIHIESVDADSILKDEHPPVDTDFVAQGVSNESLSNELEWSKSFNELPNNSIRNIKGEGEEITVDSFSIDIDKSGNTLTSIKDLSICQGINIIYGDNGAGKTLTARLLFGDISINPIFSWGSGPVAYGGHPQFKVPVDRNINAPVGPEWLAKNRYSIFFESNPSLLLTDQLVEEEVRRVYGDDGFQQRCKWLRDQGIDTKKNTGYLSYGQRKLVAFCLLPSTSLLAILDEPFANLSNFFIQAMKKKIVERLDCGDWYSVVITTNRPNKTLKTLRK